MLIQPVLSMGSFRWVEGQGSDLVVVATFSEYTRYNYRIGFPIQGPWREAFNSDVYDNWVNPITSGNGGQVYVDPIPEHGFGGSASITIPANGFVIFTR